MEELVSVVIPVYQAEKYLVGCVESVLGQTYKHVEIILVDDGSDDGSQTICDRYAEKYKNISCVHQKNKGVSCARNVGIGQAAGEYLLFVDSDDYIADDYLEKAVAALSAQGADLYLCGYQGVRKNGKISECKRYPSIKEGIWTREDISKVLLKVFETNTLHAIGTKVYRRKVILNRNIRFSEDRKYYEDIHFCLSYLCFCRKIIVENEVLYFYQLDIKNSLSKQSVNIDFESIYGTYVLLAKMLRIKHSDQNTKEAFYKGYYASVTYSMEAVSKAEGKYNNRIRRMYQQVAKDKIYHNAVRHEGRINQWEYFMIKEHLYYIAYLIHSIKY